MAAINFPSSPTQGQSYTENGQTWFYDGVKWVSGGTFGQSALTPMYQQGVWTPRLSNTGGTEVTTWSTPSLVQGDWARVGNLVTINGIVRAQNTNSVSTAGISVAIKDFPYPVDNGACYSTASIGQMIYVNVANDAAVTMYVEPTQDYCYMQIRTSSTVPADFAPSAFNSTTSGLIFSASYMTDDTTWTPINGATVS